MARCNPVSSALKTGGSNSECEEGIKALLKKSMEQTLQCSSCFWTPAAPSFKGAETDFSWWTSWLLWKKFTATCANSSVPIRKTEEIIWDTLDFNHYKCKKYARSNNLRARFLYRWQKVSDWSPPPGRVNAGCQIVKPVSQGQFYHLSSQDLMTSVIRPGFVFDEIVSPVGISWSHLGTMQKNKTVNTLLSNRFLAGHGIWCHTAEGDDAVAVFP